MKKKVYNLIVVDESGSMSAIRRQAFTGMNETLATVRSMQQGHPETDQRITLVTFDSDHTMWHLDNAPAMEARDLCWDDYRPGGCTPLYDAIGGAVTKLEAQAERDGGDAHVLVTIITDGEENSSREWHLSMVHNLIERLKGRGWTFALIGTDNLDVRSMAESMSIDEHLSFCEDDHGTRQMFERERRARTRYNDCLCAHEAMEKGSFFSEEP